MPKVARLATMPRMPDLSYTGAGTVGILPRSQTPHQRAADRDLPEDFFRLIRLFRPMRGHAMSPQRTDDLDGLGRDTIAPTGDPA
jgi:hypothetical protein